MKFNSALATFIDLQCQPINGQLTLPGDLRRNGDHVGFSIRNTSGLPLNVGAVKVSYAAEVPHNVESGTF